MIVTEDLGNKQQEQITQLIQVVLEGRASEHDPPPASL